MIARFWPRYHEQILCQKTFVYLLRIAVLERALANVPPAVKGVGVAWFGRLFGDGRYGPVIDLSQSGFSADLLLRLVRLAYHHVRPSDDARHIGSFTPDIRDHAESGRNVLLNALLSAKGPAGRSAKLEMANDPIFVHFRDRAIAIAREQSAQEADELMLDESMVCEFDRNLEIAPTTRDDMFALLVDRLDDIEDLLLQDISPRGTWALIQDETLMRREAARELLNKANRSYTVDQEAATADEKETDIRLRSTGSGQQAVIELKLGKKDRSAQDLLTALKQQLVTKYMAADESRSGCFLVTVASDRKWQHPETKQSMDFSELISMLSDEAAKIVSEMGGNLRLVARGLDLRPRLPTEKKKQNRSE